VTLGRARPRVAALCAAALALVGCQGDAAPRFPLREPLVSPTEADTLVVGFVGTLSGPDSWRGEDAFEGADLGVHMLNRVRPEGFPQFELRPLDDEGDPRRAAQLVAQLAALGSTVGVVYAGALEGLVRAEPALARAGIPAVLCYGDVPVGEDLPHVFQTSPAFRWSARRLATYLLDDRDYTAIGALVEASAAGDAAADALAAEFGRAERLVVVAHAGSDVSLRSGLRHLRRRGVEAVVVHGSPGDLTYALRALDRMGATYTTTAAARRASLRGPRRLRDRPWRPHPAAFDLAISPRVADERRGLVAPDSYARGAHYLPLQSMTRFRTAFRAWWGADPLGWERRAFDAVRILGWAAQRAGQQDDLADVVESLSGAAFSALPVTFGPDDHVAGTARTLGIWVVPRAGAQVRERQLVAGFSSFPWVPLARSFAGRRRITRILPRHQDELFGAAAPRVRAPVFARMRFGVTTPPSDPVH
jgi:ABC-type branched-subunit amino acid transport system substrate-binding protein